jgi:hypothetical protein
LVLRNRTGKAAKRNGEPLAIDAAFLHNSGNSLKGHTIMCRSLSPLTILYLVSPLALTVASAAQQDDAVLRKAVTFYASFDESPKGDFGGGELVLSTRFNHETDKGKFIFKKGFDAKVFRIAPGKGIAGDALEVVDVLPNNGRIFFPAKGNLAYKPDGWGAAVSVWINTDTEKLLKTRFCDPVQITQRGANDGGIWFDFNDAKPRDLRLGIFPAAAPGTKPIAETDADAPMVPIKGIGFKAGDWHHVVLTWDHVDSGKKDGRADLYIDGKHRGAVQNRELAMKWELDKTCIYIAVNFIGLLDEFALFDRPLTAAEVGRLFQQPGLLATLKPAKK